MHLRAARLIARVAAVIVLVAVALWPARARAALPAVAGPDALAVLVTTSLVRGADEVVEAPAGPAQGEGDASLGGDAPDEDEDDAEDRALPAPGAATIARWPSLRGAHARATDRPPPLVHLEPTTPPPER